MSNHSTERIGLDSDCGGACHCAGCAGADDVEQHGATRRQFVAYGAAALAMAALTACGMETLTSPTTLDTTDLDISQFPTLATVGGVATTTIGRVPIAIVRTGPSSFSAFSRICPHRGSTINVTSTGFRCPNHKATFDLSGTWTGGQRTQNLTSYPVQYDETTRALTIG